MTDPRSSPLSALARTDPAIHAAIRRETERQEYNLELIASENMVSEAVLEAQGSVMTNKYAEGYPGRRYYGGFGVVEVGGGLGVDPGQQLFGARHRNVQTPSGSPAKMGGRLFPP